MRKKLKQYNLSITIYFIAIELITVLLVVFFITLAFYQILESSLLEMAMTNNEQSITQVRNTINNYTASTKDRMNNLVNVVSENDSIEAIRNHMETMVDINEDIASIIIYSEDGEILEFQGNGKLKENIENNLSFDQEELLKKGDYVVTSPHVQNIIENKYPWVVTVAKKKWAGPYDQEVYLTMDIKFSSIATYIDDVGIGQHGYCFITNSSKDLVYHPLQQLIYLNIKKENLEQIDTLTSNSEIRDGAIFTAQEIPDYNWKVIGVSYISELVDSKLISGLKALAYILAIMLVLAVIVIFVLSKLITKPVRSLVVAMSEFEQNAIEFKYQPVKSFSEFNQLTHSFEHMVGQIQSLMEQVKREEITLRKTELKALQAQINPHFLYNTLDSIQWMCEQDNTKDAVVMVGALAQLFRISISKGYELITIEKELQHAQSYLLIQSYRYRDQFTYKFIVEPEVLPYLCNKITIQPIIENAIYHGISRMVDKGEITIEVYFDNDDVVFIISDNGVGMTSKQVENILKKELTDSKGIGVKNVNDRIKIYFGNNYGITVSSELDVGTVITIRIPAIKEDTYEV